MGMNTRLWAKRELERAVKQIDWVGTHTNQVYERYKEVHPEIAEPLQLVLEMCVSLQTILTMVDRQI